jgi:cell division protein FtsL
MKRWLLILLLLTTGAFALVWCKSDQRRLKSEIYKNQALLVSLDVELRDLKILQQGEISSHVQNGAELYEGLVDLKNHGLIEISPSFANWGK